MALYNKKIFYGLIFLILLCLGYGYLYKKNELFTTEADDLRLILKIVLHVTNCFDNTTNIQLTTAEQNKLNKDFINQYSGPTSFLNSDQELKYDTVIKNTEPKYGIFIFLNFMIFLQIFNKYKKMHQILSNNYCDPDLNNSDYKTFEKLYNDEIDNFVSDITCVIQYYKKLWTIKQSTSNTNFRLTSFELLPNDKTEIENQLKCIIRLKIPLNNTLISTQQPSNFLELNGFIHTNLISFLEEILVFIVRFSTNGYCDKTKPIDPKPIDPNKSCYDYCARNEDRDDLKDPIKKPVMYYKLSNNSQTICNPNFSGIPTPPAITPTATTPTSTTPTGTPTSTTPTGTTPSGTTATTPSITTAGTQTATTPTVTTAGTQTATTPTVTTAGTPTATPRVTTAGTPTATPRVTTAGTPTATPRVTTAGTPTATPRVTTAVTESETNPPSGTRNRRMYEYENDMTHPYLSPDMPNGYVPVLSGILPENVFDNNGYADFGDYQFSYLPSSNIELNNSKGRNNFFIPNIWIEEYKN